MTCTPSLVGAAGQARCVSCCCLVLMAERVVCRLRQAHKCSQQCCKPAFARPNDIEAGGGEVAVQDDEAAKQIHSQFMQMALQLVDGRLDSSQYEDSCRQLLGVHPPLLWLDLVLASQQSSQSLTDV